MRLLGPLGANTGTNRRDHPPGHTAHYPDHHHHHHHDHRPAHIHQRAPPHEIDRVAVHCFQIKRVSAISTGQVSGGPSDLRSPASRSHWAGSTLTEGPGYSGTSESARRPAGRGSIAARSSSTVISRLRLGAI